MARIPLLVAASLSLPASAQPIFVPIEPLSGATYTSAAAVSGDGTTVVGGSSSKAFRWTAAGIADLGRLRPTDEQTVAAAASFDGATVAGSSGHAISAIEAVAFRWTLVGGFDTAANPGLALGCSADGSVVVGETFFPGGPGPAPFRWTRGTGPQALGGIPGGGGQGAASAVSADGSIVVGFANSPEGMQAFRWADATGMVGLGFLGPTTGFRDSRARAISGDGSTIVGTSTGDPGSSGSFRWTQASGKVDLGTPPAAFQSVDAMAVSGDGSVIVGAARLGTATRAFIWTATTGIRDLQVHLGINAPGWALATATGISHDGLTIVGNGTGPAGPRGWLVRLVPACYANCDRSTAAPTLNVSDFVCFQQRFAAGDLYANCDRSTTTPILNVNDFVCFSASFAAGCR